LRAVDVTDVALTNNNISGSIIARPGGVGGTIISSNSVNGAYGNALTADGEHLIISGNDFTGHELGCLLVTSVSSTGVVNFVSNSCTDQGDGFITADSIVRLFNAASAGSFLVQGNSIIGKDGTNISLIDCQGEPGSIVDGNYLEDSDWVGIRECLTVTDNTLIDMAGIGILIDDDEAVVSGNRIDDAAGVCIDSANDDHLVITDNHLTACAAGGIELDGTTGSLVMGNFVDGDDGASDKGIECDDCAYTKIIGNTVQEFQNAGAIALVESAGTSNANICIGNVLLDSTATILCGDADTPGDDAGCADDGNSDANTYCGGNVLTP